MTRDVYPMFEDIENDELRARNRGVIMANIYEDNATVNGNKLTMEGTKAIVKYFTRIPLDERHMAREAFQNSLTERGIIR